MGLIAVTLPNDGETVDASDVNNPINTIVNEINGRLDNNNIKAGAAIATSKLSQDANAQFNPSIIDGASTLFFDHVMSGCVLTGTGYGTTLAWNLTSGFVYIGGRKLTVAATSGTVTASKDTYFDLLDPGTGTVATLVNTGGNIVANNAASPALAASSVRLGIIVSGANIAAATSVNQGQETMVLPIISSVPLAVTDANGNLICPRDPNRKILGYRQIVANANSSGTADTAVVGLSVPVIVPTGRKIKLTMKARYLLPGSASLPTISVWDGTVGSGTQVAEDDGSAATSGSSVTAISLLTPTATSKTYNGAVKQPTSGTATLAASVASPTFVMVELV